MKLSMTNCGLLGFIFFAVLGASSVLGGQAPKYLGASLSHEENHELLDSTVVLSAPKRISNTLEIEKQASVSGAATVRLYELKSSAQLNNVFDYYVDALSAKGDVLFQCEKRACGSSNYWANTIFDEHKLYGRDSDQYYLASVHRDGEKEYWTVIYIVKNGLRKKYVYELSISKQVNDSNPGSLKGVWVNGSILESGNLSSKSAASLNAYLNATNSNELYLVAYSNSRIKPTAEYWEQLSQKSQIQAELIKSKVSDSGVSINIKMLGPLHGDDSSEKSPVWYRLYAY